MGLLLVGPVALLQGVAPGNVGTTRAVESVNCHPRAVAAEYCSNWLAAQIGAGRQRCKRAQCLCSAGVLVFESIRAP